MDVQRRLIIRCIGDIASKGSDLGLLINRDALVFLGFLVEIAENRRTKGTNGAELCRFDLLPLDEVLQASHHLIPAVEHNDESALLSCRLISLVCMALPWIICLRCPEPVHQRLGGGRVPRTRTTRSD
jgi:hypothetical protein